MEQLEFLVAPKPNPQPVSDDVIFLQPNKLAAIRLAIAVSGLDEKEVYMAMRIDKAAWSKIMSGQFNWPTDGDEKLEEIVGNNVLTKWQMHKRGYKQPEPRLDAKDAELLKLRTELAEAKKTNELLCGLIKR